MRRRYLIAYDISDDKRREQVYRTLLDWADHVQFSVFLGKLSAKEYAIVKTQLRQYINPKEDQIILLDLGQASDSLVESRRLETLGIVYSPPQRTTVI